MGLKATQKVRQVRHNSSANFELENVGRTFELKAEPATPCSMCGYPAMMPNSQSDFKLLTDISNAM